MSMRSVEAPHDAWVRLARYVRARRSELNISSAAKACALSGDRIGTSTWSDIENVENLPGKTSFAQRSLEGVETALRWEPGSVSDILGGGGPTALPVGDDDLKRRVERLEGVLEEILRRLPNGEGSG